MYYKLYTSEKKIPIPLAIALLCLVFLLPFFYFKNKGQQKQTVTKATSIIATNITHASTSVFWQTDTKTEGILYYSTDPKLKKEMIKDDRDLAHTGLLRTYHFASLKNLKPATTYFIWLEKPEESFSPDLQFKTLARAQLSTNKPPLYGKVTDFKGGASEGNIVVVHIKNASPLAAITKSDGSFLVSLCCLAHEITMEKIVPENTDTVEIDVYSENEKSHLVADITTASPLRKSVILGQKENLIVQNTVFQSISEAPLGKTVQKFESVDIFYPKERAIIPGQKPFFKGSALPDEKVTLTFPKQKKTLSFNADGKGGWSYTPNFNLNPGQNTVIMQTIDDKTEPIKRERTFTIAKSGESVVLGEATPEATISPTTPPIGGPTIVLIETPTVEPTLSETQTPTPPVTGVSFTTFSLFSVALIAVGAGLILLF